MGLVSTASGGYSIGPLSSGFDNIGGGTLFHVPSLVFFALGIALLMHVLLEYTTLGTRYRTIGGNRDAAVALGLPVRRLTMFAYVLSGCLAAFAGVLQASNLGAADPSSGTDLELNVIAAVIVGGVSVYGAVCSVTGMVAGAVLLSSLTIALVLLHFSGTLQPCVVGIVLIAAVALDGLRRRKMFRFSIRSLAASSHPGAHGSRRTLSSIGNSEH
jgi:ribose/xylose/arabinose/galactoside ABC-type transport system permease subunit